MKNNSLFSKNLIGKLTKKEYEWCFNHSVVNSVVTNKKGRIIAKSIESREINRELFLTLKKDKVVKLDEKTELVMAMIKKGYVIWERDIEAENRLIKELSEAKSSLKEANASLKENIDFEKRSKKALEQNRLYDLTFSKVSDDVNKIEKLISLAKTKEGEEKLKLLRRIDICGVFVKRKSNLIILSETGLSDYASELKLCFKESFDNLRDGGINSSFSFKENESVSFENAIEIYSIFEALIELFLDNINHVAVILSTLKNAYQLTLNVTLKDKPDSIDLNKITDNEGVFFDVEEDEDDISVTFVIPKKEVSHGDK